MTNLRAILVVLFVVALVSLSQSASQTSPQSATSNMDWKTLEENWIKFMENPADEASIDSVLNLLPTKAKPADSGGAGTNAVELIQQGFGTLESQIYEKNAKAIQLGFRLFSIASGPFEERLIKIIGNVIGLDPLLFLQELQEDQAIIPKLETILSSYRLRDATPEDKEIERRYRLKMIENVKEKTVKEIRSECIKILNRLKET